MAEGGASSPSGKATAEGSDARVFGPGETVPMRAVRNARGQSSLCRATAPVPPGWADAGFAGSREECLRHIEAAWRSEPRRGRSDGEMHGDGSIPHRFARQAALTPDAVAITDGHENTTYGELDRRSDRLAWRLASAGVASETPIGISLPRSADLVVAILATLKAGGCYVPLDPANPRERLEFMAGDAGVALVVTADGPGSEALCPGVPTLPMVEADAAPPHAPFPIRARPDDLAYIMYTSGSTGVPKGVQIEHASVLRLFDSTRAWFAFGRDDVWTLFHSYGFDFSVWEMWGALLHGGRLVVVPLVTAQSPEAFLTLLARERVSVLNQTPSAFARLLQHDEASGPDVLPLSLRLVVFGGEALEPKLAARWFDRRGEIARLVNMYGITETTVHVTYHPLTPATAARSDGSPIGVPIPDLEILLLDEDLRPVGAGEVGEICVGGPGLARGYHGRPALTAERFVPHPDEPGARLYRSGDLAIRLPDGSYEYRGRRDRQVKLRGFRIELGEIEAALLAEPAIALAAAAVEMRNGEPTLLAYVVASMDRTVQRADLRASLARTLPSYMVPQAIVELAAFPLTENGKLDRARLAHLPPIAERPTPRGQRAGSATERELVGLWQDVLGIADPAIDVSFFDLGGTSVGLVRVQAGLRARLGRDLPLVELYAHPTLAALARHLDGDGVRPTGPAISRAHQLDSLRRASARARAR